MGGNQSWRGFGPSATVGLPPPLYAFYPLSFAELHRTMLKIMLVRYLLFLPLLAGAARLFISTLNLNISQMFLIGLKLFSWGSPRNPCWHSCRSLLQPTTRIGGGSPFRL